MINHKHFKIVHRSDGYGFVVSASSISALRPDRIPPKPSFAVAGVSS